MAQTAGFNDQGWLDNDGRPATDALRVTERFRRKDFGHMDILITIDDPKAYTKPWNVTLAADADARHGPARVRLQREQQRSAAPGGEITCNRTNMLDSF